MLKNVDCFFTRADKMWTAFSRVLKNVDCFFTRAEKSEKREVLWIFVFCLGMKKSRFCEIFAGLWWMKKIEILRFSEPRF